jgi:putative transposase
MIALYSIAGISRQAHFKALKRIEQQQASAQALLVDVEHIRHVHPRLGARKLYKMLLPPGMGRDRFEKLLLEHGYRLNPVRNYHRTTYSQRSRIYPNLISGLTITRPQQLWVTDITHFRIKERFYYITLIMDVYTRMVVGHSVSANMQAESNINALKRAFKGKEKELLKGLIHHSDRGSQYIDLEYRELLDTHGIRISMGNRAWENAHAERINGIIKNEYLHHFKINNYEDLIKQTNKTVKLYNERRPHGSLPLMSTPIQMVLQASSSFQDYSVKINY